jgi:hypothetical protein
MTSKFRVLAVCLGAALALSVFGAGAAQAARPFQPQWISNGATIKSNISVEFTSLVSRLWAPGLGNLIVVCLKDEGTALLKPGGKDEIDKLIFRNCKVAETKENSTTKKAEEGPEVSGCGADNEGGTVGIIEVPTPIKSRLVWSRVGNQARVLNLFLPSNPPTFVKLEIAKSGSAACALTTKFSVEGEQLGNVPRFSAANAYEEVQAGLQTFETKFEKAKEVRPIANEWEAEEPGKQVETGKAELTILKGSTKSTTALESYEQVERQTENTGTTSQRRSLFGATE